jgi:hypothetical protein
MYLNRRSISNAAYRGVPLRAPALFYSLCNMALIKAGISLQIVDVHDTIKEYVKRNYVPGSNLREVKRMKLNLGC